MNFFRRLVFITTLLAPLATLAQTYVVDPDSTDIRVLVYRGGLLKGLGHNHVVSVANLDGKVVLGPSPTESTVQLSFPVASLVVDDAELRSDLGADFSGDVSEKDKAGTRDNMLGRKLLDAVNFAEISIVSSAVSGEFPTLRIDAEVQVRNQTFAVSFPVEVEMNGDQLIATGEVSVTHADLGLRGFKAAFGAIRVRDELLLRYRVVAEMSELLTEQSTLP